MSRRGGVVGLIASILIACVCAGLVAWRLTPPRPHAPTAPAPAVPSPIAGPEPPVRLSTIIDLPGDPVLVRRGAVLAPKDALISVPARLGQQALQTPAKGFFVNSTLVSSTGGYMGKFQEAGQEAEALAAQLAMNSAQIAAAQNEPDTGSDDDGGAETPADAQSQFLTTANSNELEINLGGSRGQPQLKETILKPLVADTISNLLIANGFDADSARMIEGAAKDLASPHPNAAAPKRGSGRGRAGPDGGVPDQADRHLRERRIRHHHRRQGRRRVRTGRRADRARAFARRSAQEPEHRHALLDRRRRL